MQSTQPTVLIVPGLRDESPDHWQTYLESNLRTAGHTVQAVPAIGKSKLSCAARIEGLAHAVGQIDGPIVLVAHSGACLTVAHWAAHSAEATRVHAALLAVPPDFDQPMPAGYPSMEDLEVHGWYPIPRTRLPFASTVIASTNDPLASLDAVTTLARQWGSTLLNVGAVGHLNPAAGFGHWPQAESLVGGLLDRGTLG